MSQETIKRRAAAIRRTWSRPEKDARAIASDQRCIDLLLRIITGARGTAA